MMKRQEIRFWRRRMLRRLSEYEARGVSPEEAVTRIQDEMELRGVSPFDFVQSVITEGLAKDARNV